MMAPFKDSTTRSAGLMYRAFPSLALVVLVIVAILQTGTVGGDYLLPWLKGAWRTRDLSAMERSARFLLGDIGLEYLQFVDNHVPLTGSVVAPEVTSTWGEQSVYQFFLMPRGIPKCGCAGEFASGVTEDCRACLLAPNHALLAIGGYPPAEVVQGAKDFLPFARESTFLQGLYLPHAFLAARGDALTLSPPEGAPPLWTAAALDLGAILLVLILGATMVRAAQSSPRLWELIAYGFPLGLGMWTFLVFLGGFLFGLPVGIPLYVGAYAVGLVSALISLRRAGLPVLAWKRPGKPSTDRHSRLESMASILTASGLITLIAAAVVISVGRSYSTFDGIANWALKGYAIAAEGSIYAGAQYGGHGLAYPQNLPLAVAFFRVLDGDVLPGSKLIYPFMGGALLLGCFGLLRSNGVRRWPALLAMTIVATLPALFTHLTVGFANLMFTTYLVLGALSWLFAGDSGPRDGRVLGGLMLGLAAWTRPEGAGFGLAIGLLLTSFDLGRRVRRRTILSAWVPFVLVTVPWIAFGARYMAADQIGSVIRGLVSTGGAFAIDWSKLTRVVGFAPVRFTITRVWGFCLWLLPLGLWALWVAVRSRDRQPLKLALLTGLSFAIPVGMFWVALSSSDAGRTFLLVSFDRAMFPAAVLAVCLSAFGTRQIPHLPDHMQPMAEANASG